MIYNLNKELNNKDVQAYMNYPIKNKSDKEMIATRLIAYGYNLGIKNYKEMGNHTLVFDIDSVKRDYNTNSVDTKDMIINEIDLKIDDLINLSENKLKNLDFDDSTNFADKLKSLINFIDEQLEYLIYNLIEQDKLKLLELAKQGEIQLGDLLDNEYYIDDENFSGIYDSPIDSKAYIIQTLIDNIKLTIKLIKNIDELNITEIDDKIYIYQSLLSTAVSLSRSFDELDFLISDLNLLLGYKNLEE